MAAQSVTDLCVLLVDADPRSSKKMLEILLDAGYRVVMASRGDEALSILRCKKREVDLVVTHTELPDMCAFRLVEILDTDFKIAVVMIYDYFHGPTILRGLTSGAVLCLQDPPCTDQVRRFWQYALRNKRPLQESSETGDSSTSG